MTKTTSRVLVVEDKHDTYMLPASTKQELAASAYKLLKQRFGQGYWYHKPNSNAGPSDREYYLLDLDTQEIACFPEGVARFLTASQQKLRDKYQDFQEQRDFYDTVKQTVELGPDAVLWRNGREVNAAWWLLQSRIDHEYEYVELKSIG